MDSLSHVFVKHKTEDEEKSLFLLISSASLSVLLLSERMLERTNPGADVSRVKRSDAGLVLSETLRSFLWDLQVEDGLQALGYSPQDVPSLVQGTVPQERVTKLSPRGHSEDDLQELFLQSMKLY